LSSLLSNPIQEKVNVQHGNANIVEGLALSYSREKPGSRKRVELLSCVAEQYSNKELKQMFRFTNSRGEEVSCVDYELTKSRLHSKMYGPGAALPKIRRQYSHKLPPGTIAFVLEFIHHPDSVEYSSYKTAPVLVFGFQMTPPCGNRAQHQETCQSCLQIFHQMEADLLLRGRC